MSDAPPSVPARTEDVLAKLAEMEALLREILAAVKGTGSGGGLGH